MSQPSASEPSSPGEWLSLTPDSDGPEPPRPSPTPEGDALIGTTLRETYVVDHVIGEGGMGRVYHAHHARLDSKSFAIKVLRPEVLPSDQVRARFQREAEAVASIEHPGVVSAVDFGTTPAGSPYIVCERLVGVDLRLYSKRFGKISGGLLIHLGKQLAAALEASHERGVIHRDLKPSNVYLLGQFFGLSPPERPAIKILDFGLSRFVHRDDQLTHTGLVMGTPGYMAPEQAQAQPTDARTDVYGLGAVLYAAATGRAPYRAANPQQTVLASLTGQPTRPRRLNPALSENLEAVIQRALSRDPAQRFQSMRELHDALSALEPEADGDGESAVTESGARGAVVRTTLVASVLLSAGLAGAGAGGLALTGRTPSPSIDTGLVLASGALGWLPAALLARRFRRDWQSSVAMQRWRARLEPALVWALAAYALAAFGLHAGRAIVARFASDPGSLLPPDPGWSGWPIVLPSIALLAAVVRFRRGSAGEVPARSPARPAWRWAAVPVLLALAVAGWLGASRWPAASPASSVTAALHPATAANAAAPDVATASALPAGSAGPEASAANAPAGFASDADGLPEDPVGVEALAPRLDPNADPIPDPKPAPKLAHGDELTAAVAGGADALEALAGRYPRDASVWKALVLAHSSRSTGIADAVAAIRRLLTVAPERHADEDVRYILKRAAGLDGKPARAAFEVMTGHMGSAGPDLIWELLRKSELSERAAAELSKPAARAHFSQPLSIAYELRFAPSCKARLGLLARAERVGDQRSINVLSALVSKPRRCRKQSGRRCRVRCEQQAARFAESIEVIAARLRKQERERGT